MRRARLNSEANNFKLYLKNSRWSSRIYLQMNEESSLIFIDIGRDCKNTCHTLVFLIECVFQTSCKTLVFLASVFSLPLWCVYLSHLDSVGIALRKREQLQ